MMNRPQRVAAVLVVLVPIFAMLVWMGFYVSGQVTRLTANLAPIGVHEFERYLGKEVRVGKITASLRGAAVIDNIRIADGPTFAAGTLARADRVELRFDLRGLLSGRGASALSSFTVIRPRVNAVRRADGTFNISELFRAPLQPSGPPFVGTVRVIDGDVTYRDYLAGTPAKPVVMRLRNVDALVNAAEAPKYRFSVAARGTQGELASARALGVFDARAGVLKLDVSGRGVSVPLAAAFVPLPAGLQLRTGVVHPTLGLTMRRTPSRWTAAVAGVVSVTDAGASVPGARVPVTGISGDLVLTADRVAMSLRGLFAGMPVRVTGTVSGFHEPSLDLAVSSRAARFARLMKSVEFLRPIRDLSASGTAPLSLRVTGPAAHPEVAVSASIPRGSFRGYEATNIEITARYADGTVKVDSLRMCAAGGTVEAAGTVNTRGSARISIRGRALGIDAARLKLPTEEPIAGQVDARFKVTGTAAQPDVVVAAVVRRGLVRGVEVSAPSLRITYRRGTIEAFAQVAASIAGGVVRLSGRITPRTINARYVAEGLDISLLQKYTGRQGLAGVLYSTGQVTGSIRDPRIKGAAEFFGGRYENLAADYARVDFEGDRRNVSVGECVVRVFPAELRLSGKVSEIEGPRTDFQGEVHVRWLRVEQLLALLGRSAELTGTLAGDFTVSGAYLWQAPPDVTPFVDTVAAGTLRIEDGTAYRYPVDSAEAALTFRDNVLTLSETTISSQDAQITLGGTVSASTRTVNLDFTLSGFDLARLRERFDRYVTLGGVANAAGAITGSWDNVGVTLEASADRLLLNNTRFDHAVAKLAYSDGRVPTIEASLVRGDQIYGLEVADFDPQTRSLASGMLRMTSARVPDLWNTLISSPYLKTSEAESLRTTLRRVPRLTGGKLDGTLTFTGSVADPEGKPKLPDGSVQLNVENVEFASWQIDKIDLDASAAKGIISLRQFRAVSGDMYVEATPAELNAPVYQDGSLAVELAAYNVDLSRLGPWLGQNTLSGVMTARFDVLGPQTEPKVIGSVEVVNPGYGGLSFDRLRASRIDIAANTVRIADVILAANGHQMIARGYLPWKWSDFTIPADQPLEFTAELQKEDMSILASFIPLVDVSATSGAVQAVMEVGGSLSDLALSGVLQVQNGTLGLRGFRNVFNDLNADIMFDGKQVLVNRLSAQSSLGGSIEIVPGSHLTVGTLDTSELNLLVAARGLRVSESNVFGYQENITATIDAGISVTRSLRSPLVADAQIDGFSGGVMIRDADVAFVVPEEAPEPEPREFAINPRFEVGIDIGPDVTIRPPRMTLTVSGGGLVTGSLNRPDVRLETRVMRAFLMLGTSVLRVVPGGTIEITYAPPTAPQLVLRDFQANTMVTATSPLGRRERYQITLQVSGPVDRMQIKLTSSPPGLSREQMLAALGHVEGLFETAESTLQKELGNVLTAVGAGALFAPVERMFIERLGFEQFTLEYSAATPLALFISRRLFDGFYLSLYQRLGGELIGTDYVNYQLQLSYRFRRLYHFSFGVDDQQTSTVELGFQRAF